MIRELIFNPGYRVVVYYRIAVYLRGRRFPRLIAALLSKLIMVRLMRVPGVEIRTVFDIGKGFSVFHPHDIVIGAGSRIGENATIYNGVTLGARTLRGEDEEQDVGRRYPTIGSGVTIFSGAKIIGPVTIGDNSIVGANSVVTESFPANSIIAGAPARLIRTREL